MFIDITNTFFDKSVQVEAVKNYPDSLEDRSIDFERSNFSSKKEEINFCNENSKSNIFFSPMISSNQFQYLNKDEDYILDFVDPSFSEKGNNPNLFYFDNLIENERERKPYFNVIYPKKDTLLNKTENISILIKEEEEKTFLSKKKLLNEKTRKDNQDNMRKKIKRGFFNTSLIKLLNEKLKSIGSNKYLEKFPQYFIKDVEQKRNKKIFAMTLLKVFVKEEFYMREKKNGFKNYLHNLKVLQSEDIKENEEFKKILNKTIRDLYKEYINSDEFKIEEINRLKRKEMNDNYIARYIYLANHFIEFLFK